ncbi:DciA family protein [Vibrio sp. ZSDE26]|uniref:DciA family protein n=1 Tax=Vibrio amylolyticus TaxID=2847292 RepID=A0A9X1XPK4_9VIBR|nr:DciA family protein [Vibrio amylolyticus]MCK6264823.1 DciA family protein [Vibrio amylolyticus]
MRDHRPTLTQELLSESKLNQIQQHAKEILTINQELQKFLPANVVKHCRAANVRGSHLLLEVANASMKMKLDYDRLTILNHLRSAGFARLISLEVKINPSLYRQEGRTPKEDEFKKRAPLSESAAQALLIVAESAPKKIQERLKRIAQLAKK